MISKNLIKKIHSLQQKKFRQEYQLFVAEGFKVISELLDANFVPEYIFSTDNDIQFNTSIEIQIISTQEMKKISALSTHSPCLAVFCIPEPKQLVETGLIVALDAVRDPGNLGTIIRLCDWFGVTQLICSTDTVDVYNPKTIQSTMGSIARVEVHYVELNDYLSKTKLPVFGTFMNGESIYKTNFPTDSIIVFGNESNGISDDIQQLITSKITIPQFGVQSTESLNVATATAIVLSECRRNS